ncbi:MAG: hypothetical protein MUF45_03215 [Spirosomaceae bacterium]|jgi:hypothetical protein|nr:hypothetical protein [Spirosomataceae bacterium]
MILNVSINEAPKANPEGEFTYHLSAEGLPNLVKNHFIFKGDENNPFLAPRGVWFVGNKLLVADTGQNRVFIWNHFPEAEFQSPDVVLGQSEKEDTGRNAGNEVSANSLQYPSGLWSDGQKLIIADAWNHRVLIWHSFPTQNGQKADVVVGQADFEHNQPNIYGIGSNPNAQSLNWPYGVFSDGQQLWICDTGNRRVLYYRQIPTQNFATADGVIGKPNFTERDYENNDPIWPYSVKINANGQMSIADTQFYRNLIWKDWKTAFHQKADTIIGQPDFDACGQNQYNLFPIQNSMNWTYDSFFYDKGIFIADTGNSRILWFDELPTQNAALASNLIGHRNFNIGSENSNTRYGTDKQLYWPFSICIDQNQLIVADTGNHRIIKYEI